MGEKRYWNEEIETKSKEEMRYLQEKKLLKKISYVYENSAFHKKLWDEKGIKPKDIKTLEDFQKYAPCFNKDMLRAYRNETGDGFCGIRCLPLEQCVFASMSTGTTGDATFPIFTRKDVEIAVENGARNLWTIGGRPGSRYLYDLPHHPIIASLLLGGVKIGAVTLSKAIPFTSEFEIERHIAAFKYFKPTLWFILSTPTFSIMNDYFNKKGVDPKRVFPKGIVAIYGGETISKGMRKSIFDDWGIEVFVQSGTGDFCWINIECNQHNGLHSPDDLTLVEVVDPETNKPVPPGERGELVITTLDMEAAPVVRFRMDDIVTVTNKKCECGRTTSRLHYYDRKTNETRIGGKSVFPIEVREILEEFSETKDGIVQIVQYAEDMEMLKLRAVYDQRVTKDVKELGSRIESKFEKDLGMRTKIELINLDEFSALSHKFPRVVKEC